MGEFMRWGIFAIAVAFSASGAQAQDAPHSKGWKLESYPRPIAITSWVTPDDFPVEARQLPNATVVFRLMVDATGVPTSCEITRSSGVAAIDDHTCRLLQQRARFKPGVNASGKPIPGTYSNAMRWQQPTLPPTPPKYNQDVWRHRANP